MNFRVIRETPLKHLTYTLIFFLCCGVTYAETMSMPTLSPMLKKTMPAVVNIATVHTVKPRVNPLVQDPFFQHFFNLQQLPEQKRQSQGSGVIVDAKAGYILTNHHVIEGADEIMVTLLDGRQFVATAEGSDAATDIALLKVKAEGLKAIPFADSDQLEIGDFVVAIGNPFGLGQTVTSGIISALGRSGLGIQGYEDFIQTDASINPGNSGGALVNFRGELIGINTAIIAPGGGNVGIGFAIPMNMAAKLMQQLKTYGKIERGILGVEPYLQNLTYELAETFGLKNNQGALVNNIVPASIAAEYLQSGDIITHLDDKPILNAAHLRMRLGLYRPSEKIILSVWRQQALKSLEITLQAFSPEDFDGESLHKQLQGATFSNINFVSTDAIGVELTALSPTSLAARLGFRLGDRLKTINNDTILSTQQLATIDTSKGVMLVIERQGYLLSLQLPPQ